MGSQLGLAGACGRPDVVQGGGVHALHIHEIGRRLDDAVPGCCSPWEWRNLSRRHRHLGGTTVEKLRLSRVPADCFCLGTVCS